jgi:hypothetical protein
MCLTCGCGSPNDDHGNPDHITHDDVKKAAEAAGIKPKKAVKNLRKGMKIVEAAAEVKKVAEVTWQKPAPVEPPQFVRRMDPSL